VAGREGNQVREPLEGDAIPRTNEAMNGVGKGEEFTHRRRGASVGLANAACQAIIGA
jgi:hypothetical protein